jgi:signal peptidase
MTRTFRRIGLLLAWIVIGAFGGFVLAVGLPNFFGARSLTVMSGSMEPAIGTGDVVVAVQIPPTAARVGDIVTFRDPLNDARLITHRVREMHVRGEMVAFVTKGDANSTLEQWAVPETGTIGRVSFHVPRIGYMMVWIRSTIGLLMLIVLPTLLLGATELWRLWRPHGAHEPGVPQLNPRTPRLPQLDRQLDLPLGVSDARAPRRRHRRRVPDEVVA